MGDDGAHGAGKPYRFGEPMEGQALKAKLDPAELRQAQLAVTANALDAEDARLLLDMLGLLPETTKGDDRRVLGWRRV